MNHAHVTALLFYFAQIFFFGQVMSAKADRWALGLLFAWGTLVCLAGAAVSFKRYLKEPAP